MASAITTCTFTLTADVAIADTAAFGKPKTSEPPTSLSVALTAGTGAGAASKVYWDSRALAGTTRQTYDLSGALLNPLGEAVVFTKVRAIFLVVTSGPGPLEVGGGSDGAGANAFVSWLNTAAAETVIDKALVVIRQDATAYAVTAGTGDIFAVYNSGATSTTYKLILVGE